MNEHLPKVPLNEAVVINSEGDKLPPNAERGNGLQWIRKHRSREQFDEIVSLGKSRAAGV
jgi:hypothetical protein